MPMTTAQGKAAIETALEKFAEKRELTFLTQDKENEMNADLEARLTTALADAWSD